MPDTAPASEPQTEVPFSWPMLKRDDLIFLDDSFKDACFIVECTGHEQFFLWSEYAKASLWPRDQAETLQWEDRRSGYLVKTGEVVIDGEACPVMIEIRLQEIEGKILLFFTPTSTVVHWGLIEKWWEENFPLRYDGSRRAYCNAMNFSHALNVIHAEDSEASDAN